MGTCFDFSNGSAPSPPPAPIPPAEAKCCFSKWGPLDGCGKYPSDAHGGCSNTDWGHKCQQDGDCKNVPPPPTPTPPKPSPVPTTPAPAPAPRPTPDPPSKPKCCWSRWGDKDSCSNYPSGASGARCNTDPAKTCQSDSDCSAAPTPSPAPVPPRPSPTPPTPIAPHGDVEACH